MSAGNPSAGDLGHAASPPPIPVRTERLVLRYAREDDAEALRRRVEEKL